MKKRKVLNWEYLLKKRGYRITDPRREILSILETINGHPNAREIFLQLSKKQLKIGLTTIYRTLDLFVKLGMLNKCEFGDRQNRYEIVPEKSDHHHHLICEKCGKVIEYRDLIDEETKLVKKLENSLTKKYGFEIRNHELKFYGYCKKCLKSINIDNP